MRRKMKWLLAAAGLAGVVAVSVGRQARAQDNCRWVEHCVRWEDECVPGCDPPDENGTVHGCSSCYRTVRRCVDWDRQYFCPNT